MALSVFASMRVFFLFVSLLASAFTLIGEEASGPVITVRKGTAIVVETKEISDPAGSAASSVLKDDIQLSGALSSGDPSAATVIVNTGSSFSAQAMEKTGCVVLQKSYGG